MKSHNRKPSRGRPRKKSRDAVLDVAMKAYWDDDPADLSVNAICQMADVSKPSLYRSFGSEDGLTCASLDRYAETVLTDVFAILHTDTPIQTKLDELIDFASADARMEHGCLFYKMRAGKHRLGPKTKARVDEISASAVAAFEACLQNARDAGEWAGTMPVGDAAEYLSEQIALAFTQRASGVDPVRIRAMLSLSLSVFGGHANRVQP